MSESKFVILGAGMVAGYSAWSIGLKPAELAILSADTGLGIIKGSQIMDVSEFYTWSVHGSRSRASRNNQLVVCFR